MTDNRFFLELLLETFNNFIDGGDFYLFEFLLEASFNDSIEVSQCLSDLGVKVVFDVVVRPEMADKITCRGNMKR